MSSIVFAFGKRPALDAQDAEDLAALLSVERSLAARRLARKLRATRQPEHADTSIEIDADADELAALAALLKAIEIPDTRTSWRDLRDELRRLRGGG